MRKDWIFLGLALGVAAGCGRINYDGGNENLIVVSTSGDRLAGPDTMTSIDELEPGTVGVTLREAIVIANNTPGEELIFFDRDAFKAGTNTQILLTSDLPVITGDGLTIDANGADVTIMNEDGMPKLFEIEANDVTIRGIDMVTDVLCGVPLVRVTGAERVVFEGNTFNAPNNALIADQTIELGLIDNIVNTGTGFTISNSGGMDIRGNVFASLRNPALRISNSSTFRVRENKMVGALSDQIEVSDSSNVYIDSNELRSADDATGCSGISLVRVDNSHIGDNVVVGGGANQLLLVDSSGNHFEGNILSDAGIGIALEGSSSDNMIFRNIVVSSDDGVYVATAALNNTVVHNTVYDTASAMNFADEALVEVGNNLVTASTFDGFVDPENLDFRLVKGNQFIDAGEELGFDCVPGDAKLFKGAAPDLGAVESQ
jgi:parallel beta-helix repeat protein